MSDWWMLPRATRCRHTMRYLSGIMDCVKQILINWQKNEWVAIKKQWAKCMLQF